MAAPSSEIAQALVAFHKNPPKIPFDSQNPHFGNRYAGLPGVAGVILPAAAKVDLTVLQFPCVINGGMPGLRTVLMHVSGEAFEDTMPLAVDKPGPQALGSALTYARRYSLLSVFGLVADEDDDANAASAPAEEKPGEASPPVSPTAAGATDEQRVRMASLGNEIDKAELFKEGEADKLADSVHDDALTFDKAEKIIASMEKRLPGVPF